MLKTAVCNLFGIQYPVIQGGMTHLATAELVSAVSNNGGLGVIAAGNYEGEWLRQQICLIHRLTARPFAVNLYLRSPLLQEQIKVLVKQKIQIVITGAGNPNSILPILKANGIKTAVVAGDVSSAVQAEKGGADVVIAEGMQAGGHIGKVSTMVLLKMILETIKKPVIAAGGISDGIGLASMLKLGAQGVQMGTRFICSDECPAHLSFKRAIITSGPAGTVILGQIRGPRIRCLTNRFSLEYQALEKAGAANSELQMFIQGRLYQGVIEGDLVDGCLMAGESSGKIKDIKPVKQIMQDIVNEAEKALNVSEEEFINVGDS